MTMNECRCRLHVIDDDTYSSPAVYVCIYMRIGFAAGTFGSLVGMGGAFVMIPAMTGILKFSQHQAHGK